MAESERMAALKRAYVDMLLNTAKAGAERVMESEKKARGFQHELVAVKEESLRLLLRLKHIIHDKESELLKTSTSQKSKIDVLESQLQEAESVIIDLRAELRNLCREVEKVKNYHDQPQSDTIMNENELSHRNAAPEPITLVPSRPELQTVMSSEVDQSSTTEDVLMSRASNISNVGRMNNFLSNIYEERLSNLSSFMNNNAEWMKFSSQEVRNHANMQIPGEEKTSAGNFETKRGSYPNEATKPYEAPAILSRRKLHLGNGNVKSHKCSHTSSVETCSSDTKKNSRESEEILRKNDHSASEQMIAREAKRQKKVDAASCSFIFSPDEILKVCQPSFRPARCNSYSFLLRGNGNSSEDGSKVNEMVNLKPLPRLDPGFTLIKGGDSICGAKNVKMLNDSNSLQNASKKDHEQGKAESGATSQNSADQLDDRDSKMEMAALMVEYSGSECIQAHKETAKIALVECSESEGAKLQKECNISCPGKAENRSVKYTFHRRRKKEALSSIDENICWDKNNLNMTVGEKQNYSPKHQKKFNLVNESSRDEQRLAQVARQLIRMCEQT